MRIVFWLDPKVGFDWNTPEIISSLADGLAGMGYEVELMVENHILDDYQVEQAGRRMWFEESNQQIFADVLITNRLENLLRRDLYQAGERIWLALEDDLTPAFRHFEMYQLHEEIRVFTLNKQIKDQLHQAGIEALFIRPGIKLERCKAAGSKERENRAITLGIFDSRPETARTVFKGVEMTRVALNRMQIQVFAENELEYKTALPVQVKVKPVLEERIRCYQNSDLLIYIPGQEKISLFPLEAMAFGVPVILPQHPVLQEYARPRQNCLLLSRLHPQELALAILNVAKIGNLREQLKLQGVKTGQEYDLKQSLRSLEQLWSGQGSTKSYFIPADLRTGNAEEMVDVVILNNGDEGIKQCLDSLRKTTAYPHRVTVVDNGSGEDTLSYLRKERGINLLVNQQNTGSAGAYNQGILAGKGQYIFLAHSDLRFTDGWLTPLLAEVKHQDVGMVIPRLISGEALRNDANSANDVAQGNDKLQIENRMGGFDETQVQGDVEAKEPLDNNAPIMDEKATEDESVVREEQGTEAEAAGSVNEEIEGKEAVREEPGTEAEAAGSVNEEIEGKEAAKEEQEAEAEAAARFDEAAENQEANWEEEKAGDSDEVRAEEKTEEPKEVRDKNEVQKKEHFQQESEITDESPIYQTNSSSQESDPDEQAIQEMEIAPFTSGMPAGPCLIKRELLNRLGLLDESFARYGEDLDYSLRVREKGYKVSQCAASTVIYDPATLPTGQSAIESAASINVRDHHIEQSAARLKEKWREIIPGVKRNADGVVILGLLPWQKKAQRTQALVDMLTEQGLRVVYVEPYCSNRLPQSHTDDQHIFACKGSGTVYHNLANQGRSVEMAAELRAKLILWGIRTPLLWVEAPWWEPFLKHLEHRLLVYVTPEILLGEEIETFQHLKENFPGAERALLKATDLVIAGSRKRQEELERERVKTLYSPGGFFPADLERFLKGYYTMPEELAQMSGCKIGILGTFDRYFPKHLLREIASKHPEVSLVLIGEITCDLGELTQFANLHFLGNKGWDYLLDCIYFFDVMLYPFAARGLNTYFDPFIVNYFLAMGKPVIAFDHPEMLRFSRVVERATGDQEFCELVSQTVRRLEEEKSDERIRERLKVVRGNSWEEQTQEIYDEINIVFQAPELEVVEAPEPVAPEVTVEPVCEDELVQEDLELDVALADGAVELPDAAEVAEVGQEVDQLTVGQTEEEVKQVEAQTAEQVGDLVTLQAGDLVTRQVTDHISAHEEIGQDAELEMASDEKLLNPFAALWKHFLESYQRLRGGRKQDANQ